MATTKRQLADMVSLSQTEGPPVSLEELERRLESQMAAVPMTFDDAHCLYYLCTTRCSGTKCPVYCECDVVVDLGGSADGP